MSLPQITKDWACTQTGHCTEADFEAALSSRTIYIVRPKCLFDSAVQWEQKYSVSFKLFVLHLKLLW